MAHYILTTGSHSDFQILGVYVGPDDVDLLALAKRWAREFPEKAAKLGDPRSGKEYFDSNHFREFVIREVGLTPVPSEQMWLPDYSLDMNRWVKQ